MVVRLVFVECCADPADDDCRERTEEENATQCGKAGATALRGVMQVRRRARKQPANDLLVSLGMPRVQRLRRWRNRHKQRVGRCAR